jgi:GH35 family endo-1,4-beta-xylanase
MTRGRPARLLGIAVALLAASLLTASSAAGLTLRSEFYGIVQTATLDAQDEQGMQAAKVHLNRFILKWVWVEPTQGHFDWGSSDRFIGELASRGIRALPSVWGNPDWVAGGSATPPTGGTTAQQQWKTLLKALVTRYGPGGDYWDTKYHQQFGAAAVPLPITSWQIWNEPSLTHYFNVANPVQSYADLLRLSHDVITGADPHAQIVLAGVPGFGTKGALDAWQFLSELVRIPGINEDFDVVSLHPYSRDVDQLESEIKKMRAVMKENGDASKPLWITELGWGSDPPDRFGFNKGVDGQKQLLTQAYSLLLREHTAWHLDRVYWFEWRDPPASAQVGCSFCSSAGLLQNDRQPKPAYDAFTSFTQGKGTGG